MTVDDKVTAQDVLNSGNIIWKNGAEVRDLSNNNTVNITGNVNSRTIVNTNDMDITGDITATGNGRRQSNGTRC